MSRRLIVGLITVGFLILSIACTRLGEPGPTEQKLTLENVTLTDSIPAKWGKLISVSSPTGVEDWVQLWFVEDEGNIRVVRFNVRHNYLSSKTVVIHRN